VEGGRDEQEISRYYDRPAFSPYEEAGMRALRLGFAGLLLAAGMAAGDGAALAFTEQLVKAATPELARLDKCSTIMSRGDLVYAGCHYGGCTYVFRRDQATGKLAQCALLDIAAEIGKPDQHMDMHCAAAGSRVYLVGVKTHAGDNSASLGMYIYTVDPTTGAHTKVKNLPCDAGRIMVGPDEKHLYLFAEFSNAVRHYVLDPQTGEPVLKDSLTAAKGIAGRTAAAFSADGKYLYAVSQKELAVAVIEVGRDGSLKAAGSVEFGPQIAADPAGVGLTVAPSPDGRHVYAGFGYFSGTKAQNNVKCNQFLGLWDRDPRTGLLAFKESLPVAGMVFTRALILAPDGIRGYFAASGEGGSNCVGSFTRDPATGKLADIKPVKETQGHAPFCLALTADAADLYAGCWDWSNPLVGVFGLRTGQKVVPPAPPAAGGKKRRP
jgi:6-phosphogluconolactonase (cycloisomerase 2 family)